TAAWKTGSHCCAAVTAAPPTAIRPCSRSSSGPGTCWTPASSARCGGRGCFHDGFTLEGAETVLGPSAFDAVRGLVDQSLLSVRETLAGVRYRMLETVREF